MKAEGRVEESEEGEGGWARGTVKQPEDTGFRRGTPAKEEDKFGLSRDTMKAR